ncbi:hypothetical protein BDQ17DRAFT_1416164 [Cyathus striatus]|nr:hypothetical protein BDQ17DRAFT_1416164 [Cyathus striatus]
MSGTWHFRPDAASRVRSSNIHSDPGVIWIVVQIQTNTTPLVPGLPVLTASRVQRLTPDVINLSDDEIQLISTDPYQSYHKSSDQNWIKAAVNAQSVSRLLGTIHFNYGNLEAFLFLTWSFKPIIVFVVQIVYARRIYTLLGERKRCMRIVLVTAVLILAFASAADAFENKGLQLAYVIEETITNLPLYSGPTKEPLFSINSTISIISDLFIAGTLCMILSHNRSGVKKTNSVLMILIILTVNTGLLLSSVELAAFITTKIWAKMSLGLANWLVLGNSSLNIRTTLRQMNGEARIYNVPSSAEHSLV